MRQIWSLAIPVTLGLFLGIPSAFGSDETNKDVGKVAPMLTASGWVGSPVSLGAVKGNTVVLAFWNGDVPC